MTTNTTYYRLFFFIQFSDPVHNNNRSLVTVIYLRLQLPQDYDRHPRCKYSVYSSPIHHVLYKLIYKEREGEGELVNFSHAFLREV